MIPCIFCDILAGAAPANFVCRDELVAAFMDIHPVNTGHVLVVPVAHTELLAKVDEQTLGHMFHTAQKVEVAIRTSGIRCEGINLFLADGRPAGQEVMHVHLHIIPRFSGDGHRLRFSPSYIYKPSLTELETTAELIRSQLRGEA